MVCGPDFERLCSNPFCRRRLPHNRTTGTLVAVPFYTGKPLFRSWTGENRLGRAFSTWITRADFVDHPLVRGALAQCSLGANPGTLRRERGTLLLIPEYTDASLCTEKRACLRAAKIND